MATRWLFPRKPVLSSNTPAVGSGVGGQYDVVSSDAVAATNNRQKRRELQVEVVTGGRLDRTNSRGVRCR